MEIKQVGNKKKGKYGVKKRPGEQYQQPVHYAKKRKFSTGMKALLALSIVAIIAVAWVFSSQSSQPAQPTPSALPYPETVAGVFYTSPAITLNGARVTLPSSFVNTSKLVFVDLKLEKQTNELTYQGRSIPLGIYKGGNYLPLIIISTPSQKVISGIRVCEPCGSFSFHIVQGKYLDCDACGTKWDIETLKGVSGGCPDYPPPKLSAAVGENIDIDLSPLQLKVTG